MAINLYELLKIKSNTNIKEIEKAITEAELLGTDSALINAARQFLLNKEKRKKYDLMLAKAKKPNYFSIKSNTKNILILLIISIILGGVLVFFAKSYIYIKTPIEKPDHYNHQN